MNWEFWDSSTPYLVGAAIFWVIALYRLLFVEKLGLWRIWFDNKGEMISSPGVTLLLVSILLLFLGLAPFDP
ncbi:hypothetical protein COT44_04060 [Candidatus Shapirobacteria bacterium CG08_land_8_20_14_0_20_39_18]|uniref:Uncharacterized protein n=1 Tax=Candidatus Shapirobacteria bacterium CG08_land_8_20_14_0_20_39_18 TaxID=1974883 RepID=A0A2M6XC57_9BACT|nr:MAG: hypothetical protein COT44_04060 [Candidatus Shapirobacteria bacterium CG08_land_8_20_14_0_20_39_18]PIY66063.1 MAG: hypothetical protein COY91_01155 [Candidatus Shapirobacteria bacterium CG_4_10_14_0_8_um_filter_39_15]PJE68253.1 MAG: hypothetical protein COU94_02905 [Candidatus Shapirobacteria bacterium CG10_big_fil_rev_8_21_14_0_10_38_8]